MITERQEKILNTIVQEYINSAQPVSSQLLEKRHNFGICPATIRIEMQKLTNAGFIFQPHTSAGRMPTDKGYRFFVDDLFEREFSKEIDFEEGRFDDWIEKEITDSIKILRTPERQRREEKKVYFLRLITKNLSSISSNLVLGYLPDLKILWKDGWEEIIKEPEFGEKKLVDDFVGMIESFEEEIDGLKINSDTELTLPSSHLWERGGRRGRSPLRPMEVKAKKSAKKSVSSFVSSSTRRMKSSSPIKVYIGKENPFPKAKEFSIIITKCHFPVGEEDKSSSSPFVAARVKENGILAILGPKRMDYNKNICSLNSLIKLLEKV